MFNLFNGYYLLIPFLIVLGIIFIIAYLLSYFALGLKQKTNIYNVLIGTVLIASVTSIPELTNAIMAPLIKVPVLAIFNVFGANLLTITILALINIIWIKKNIFNNVNKINQWSILLLLITNILFLAARVLKVYNSFLNISWLLWIYGIFYLFYLQKIIQEPEQENIQEKNFKYQAKIAVWGFIISAISLIIMSILLIKVTSQMALPIKQKGMGLGLSVAGTIFLSIATTLPEIMTFIWLIKMKAFNMAIAGILGSHILNILMLFITDGLTDTDSIISLLVKYHQTTVILLSGIICYILLYLILGNKGQKLRKKSLFISFFILIIYIINTINLI